MAEVQRRRRNRVAVTETNSNVGRDSRRTRAIPLAEMSSTARRTSWWCSIRSERSQAMATSTAASAAMVARWGAEGERGQRSRCGDWGAVGLVCSSCSSQVRAEQGGPVSTASWCGASTSRSLQGRRRRICKEAPGKFCSITNGSFSVLGTHFSTVFELFETFKHFKKLFQFLCILPAPLASTPRNLKAFGVHLLGD